MHTLYNHIQVGNILYYTSCPNRYTVQGSKKSIIKKNENGEFFINESSSTILIKDLIKNDTILQIKTPPPANNPFHMFGGHTIWQNPKTTEYYQNRI